MYYVYIVRCRDDSLYTGFTKNYTKRVQEHNTSKRGCKKFERKTPCKTRIRRDSKDFNSSATEREGDQGMEERKEGETNCRSEESKVRLR
jgi:putative endonuclease